MGLRFYKRMRIAPGLTANLSPSGASLSVGARGAHVTVGPGGTRATVGVPGTGIYYTHQERGKPPGSEGAPSRVPDPVPEPYLANRLRVGWLRRMFTPPEHAAFVDALRAYALGNEEEALQTVGRCGDLADAHYLAGIVLMKSGRLVEAAERFEKALAGRELGALYRE